MKLTPIDTSKWPVAAPGPDERVAMREELARLRRENADMLGALKELHQLIDFDSEWRPCGCFSNSSDIEEACKSAKAAILAAERQTIGQTRDGNG